jgi:uncharacterized membrane protein
MWLAVICTFFALIMLTLVFITYRFPALTSNDKKIPGDKKSATPWLPDFQRFVYAGLAITVISIAVCIYIFVKGTGWEGHMMEWLNLIIRLMHITFGIAWIGASFYFVFLENALNRTKNLRDELAGNLWAIHGGGFYYLEKYKNAPSEIPEELHWFKYEAYFTWLSGFCLLFVVYYFNASSQLIDKNILDISPLQGILTGIASFIVAWFVYDGLCKTPLVHKSYWFALTGFIVAAGFAFFYTKVFAGRAAYMHFGAMLGTLMAANVFFIIIPSQKAMVRAAKEGKTFDPELGKHAGLRSLHNNYLTLPVLFVMISNHFPGTYGNKHAWIVLSVITLGTAGVKHYLNLKEKNREAIWIMPVSVLIILAAVIISAPPKDPAECRSKVSFAEVNMIIQNRCVSCHSSRPTDDFYMVAPNGVAYDTPADILKRKDLIMQRAVVTRTMPLNNKTNITQQERDMIRCWIEQGAPLN